MKIIVIFNPRLRPGQARWKVMLDKKVVKRFPRQWQAVAAANRMMHECRLAGMGGELRIYGRKNKEKFVKHFSSLY